MTEKKGWTLVARFSNADDSGKWSLRGSQNWWQYDIEDTKGQGNTTNPSDNDDMISPAFWLVSGYELMITRNDDPYTALLQTTGGCLSGETFKSKIASNQGLWEKKRCNRGSCHVEYGGNYQNTEGFIQANYCSNGFQRGDEIGFWCRYKDQNAAAMMIGGGGDDCSKADHGIGIKDHQHRRDFGNEAEDQSLAVEYSLNLWVR